MNWLPFLISHLEPSVSISHKDLFNTSEHAHKQRHVYSRIDNHVDKRTVQCHEYFFFQDRTPLRHLNHRRGTCFCTSLVNGDKCFDDYL